MEAKKIIVTGGANRIGRSIALELANYDSQIVIHYSKSIVAANIGITPMNDGRLIRVPIPELSEERRKDMVKIASRTTEDQRVTVRNIRRDANDQIKNLEKQNELTEDDRKQSLDEIQKITNEIISKMDNLLTSKEKEIMEV